MAIDAAGDVWLPTGIAGVFQFDPASGAFAGPYNFRSDNGSNIQQVAVDLNDQVWVAGHTASYVGYTSVTNPQRLTSIDTSLPAQGGLTPVAPLTIAIGPSGELRYGYSGMSTTSYGLASILNGTVTPLATLTASPASQNQNLVDAGFLTQPSSTAVRTEFVNSNNVHRTINNGSSTRAGQITQAKNTDTLYPLFDTSQICHYNSSCTASGFAGLNHPLGLATDGLGHQWAVNTGNNSISTFTAGNTGSADVAISPNAYVLGSTYLPAPSAVAIDQSGNVWISNPFSAPYVLTEIVGAAGPTIQPLAAQYQTPTGFLVGTRPNN